MRYKTEQEFSKAIAGGKAQGVLLLCGSEDFLIQNWRRAVLGQFGGEEGFNLQKLDGTNPDLDALYDATQMLPLFSSEKCVYLADLDPSKLIAAEMKKLEQVFEQLPPECVLLITARAPAFDGKKATGKKLMALADTYGGVLELNGRDRGGLVRFVQSQAKQGGGVISAELSRYLIELCGNDMQALTNEIGKVVGYAGQSEITKEHIDAVVSPKIEAKVFDLGRSIMQGKAAQALAILQDLLYMRESPVAITATLIMSYTDVYRGRIAKDEGKTAQDVSALFAYRGMDFRVRNAFGIRITTKEARGALELLFACEGELKGSRLDPAFVIEKTVLALLAVQEG